MHPAMEELTQGELDACDPDYQVLVAARAVKAAGTPHAAEEHADTAGS